MNDKRVTHAARRILKLWNIGVFGLVWILYYNAVAFQTYRATGACVSILVYALIYGALCDTYKAFRIASTTLTEIVLSQTISLGLAGLIMWAECCLVHNGLADIRPGVLTVLFQMADTALICAYAKQYLLRCTVPEETLVIYGDRAGAEEANAFVRRLLHIYSHLFSVEYIRSETETPACLDAFVSRSENIILYDVSPEKRMEIMQTCLRREKTFLISPRIEDILVQGCTVRHLLDTPLLKYEYAYENKGGQAVKRGFDLLFSAALLLLLSPVLLLIACMVKAEDGGEVFYRQRRVTKGGEIFTILKFRSMVPDAEKFGVLPTMKKDPRITKIGSFLRKTRLDELPQLVNILKGEMSFVGPRPERIVHVRLYEKEMPEFKYRLKVKGGLTGYAQVYGKYNTTPYDKLRLDLLYIENQSLVLDMKILLLTVRAVLQAESTEGFSEEKSQSIAFSTAFDGMGFVYPCGQTGKHNR